MIEITCPSCGSSSSMSLLQPAYEGPYRCWKCRSLFVISIEDGKVNSYTPMSEEELEKWQEQDEG
jgi:hypothetical protein